MFTTSYLKPSLIAGNETEFKSVLFVHFCLVVGEKESETGTVNVRSRGGKQLGRRPIEEVMASLIQLRDTRSNMGEF